MLRILPVLGIAIVIALITALTVKAQTNSDATRIEVLEKKINIESSKQIRKLFKIENGKLMSTNGQSSGLWLCNGSECFCDYRIFDCTEGVEICNTRNDGQPDTTCHNGICECKRDKPIPNPSGGLSPPEYLAQ